MSRQIKFRAWDADSKKYWNIENWHVEDEYIDLIEPNNSNADPNVKRIWKRESDVVIEQFTGLKDENGKEIYEGDILSWHSNIYRKQDWIGLVKYRGAGFVVQESDKSYSSPEWLDCACRKDANIIEVIGNIHKNPELLEADE